MEAKMALEELARQERLEYFRQWRKDNPDKVKAANRAYWEKRAARKLKEEAANG